jgi:hypothetical protein
MSRALIVPLVLAVFPVAVLAAQPDYLAKALRGFSSGKIPPDVGYVMEVTRNSHRIRERFDPARPAAEQWTLLEFAGRAPTPEEIAAHRISRAKGGESASFRADFTAADIDRSSLKLESENADTAVYSGAFTEDAAERDGFLGRLALRLTVDKRRAEVTAYEIRLLRPFSPVLGVKIHELVAGAEFHRPPGIDTQLPRRTWSRFKGRIFFSTTQEELDARYSDYARAPTAPAAR